MGIPKMSLRASACRAGAPWRTVAGVTAPRRLEGTKVAGHVEESRMEGSRHMGMEPLVMKGGGVSRVHPHVPRTQRWGSEAPE